MARPRSKKRTHAGAKNPAIPSAAQGHADMRDPKSMVIRIGAGQVGSNVSQLAADVRRVMEPGTASRLKERRGNRLRDFVTMCSPLGVTHLLLFSRSDSGNTNIRLAVVPRGPTLHFRIEKYSLGKDVQRAQRHPRGGGKEFATAPLLVMNNFSSPTADARSKVPKHLESLVTSVFRSLFPPINPQTTPLKSIRRVLLLNRENSNDDSTFVINFRHYAITTKSVGLSKPLKRLNAAEKFLSSKKGKKHGLPNLGNMHDIADYMIGGDTGTGHMTDGTSGSEVDTDAEVEVLEIPPKKVTSTKNTQSAASVSQQSTQGDENVKRRAVKLVELGPRIQLRLTKAEEGLCGGKVLWHEYIHKSKEEIKAQDRVHEERHKAKEARKKQQRENIEKKRKVVSGTKSSQNGHARKEDDAMDVDDDDDDDALYSEIDEYEEVSGHDQSSDDGEDEEGWEDGDDMVDGD